MLRGGRQRLEDSDGVAALTIFERHRTRREHAEALEALRGRPRLLAHDEIDHLHSTRR